MRFPRPGGLACLAGGVLSGLCLASCGAPVEPDNAVARPVLENAPPLAHRHRHHSLTESPDGQTRIYAAQRGDVTDLMVMRREGQAGWSAPVLLELPRRETNTSPRFFPDGTLYYSSDAPHPERPGRKDLNIWRVCYEAGHVGTPEVLPDVINTGSNEDGFAPLGGDRAVFSSTTLGGVGGYDLYIAERQDETWGETWAVSPFAHNTMMADSHPATSPDGKVLIWYAHLPVEAVYGSVDLFVSLWDGAGWSDPKNLGPAVNTDGIEYGAGVSADGETLFFSRDGVLLQSDFEAVLLQAGFVAPR